MLPEAIDLMNDLRYIYRDQSTKRFVEIYLRDRNLSPEETESLQQSIEDFLMSNLFVETGAAYLTALFQEAEIYQIHEALRSDSFLNLYDQNYPAVQKVQRLFNQIEPYLYQYLERTILPQAH